MRKSMAMAMAMAINRYWNLCCTCHLALIASVAAWNGRGTECGEIMRVSHFWFYFVRLDRIVIAVVLFHLPFRTRAGQTGHPFAPQIETAASLACPIHTAEPY